MIKFDKIQPQDKDYFLELNNAPETIHQMEHGKKFTEQDFVWILMDNTNTEWYIIESHEKIHKNERRWIKDKVGLFTVYANKDRVYLGIIIDPNFRRQGYARRAFETYLEMTDKSGFDTWLGCYIGNPGSKLYRELGYVVIPGYKTISKRKYITMVRRSKAKNT